MTCILHSVSQKVIGADTGGIGGHQLGIDSFAVQALLQVTEAGDLAVGHDDQLAVDGPFEGQGFDHIWEGFGDVVASAGIEARDALFVDGLNADTVPLPLGGIVGGVELGEVDGFIQGLGQHHRSKPARRGG